MAGAATLPPYPYRLGVAVRVLGGGGLPGPDTRRWQSGPHPPRSLDPPEPVLDHLEAKAKDLAMAWLRTRLAPPRARAGGGRGAPGGVTAACHHRRQR